MTTTISLWVALVVLGSGPEQGLIRPDAELNLLLACYHSSTREFIKEEKERLSVRENGTDDTIAPHESYDLEQVSELFYRLFHIIKTLFKPDESYTLVTRKDSPGHYGRLPEPP